PSHGAAVLRRTAMSLENAQAEPSIKDVMSGIVSDMKKLASQQFALLRSEMQSDWDKTKRALWPMITGIIVASVGMILTGFAAALGLYWYVSPPGADPARLPLWACFGFASLGFLLVGAGLIAAGVRLFQSFNPLPNETAEAFERNLKGLV